LFSFDAQDLVFLLRGEMKLLRQIGIVSAKLQFSLFEQLRVAFGGCEESEKPLVP
jgi:hypothetical protein